MINKITYLFIIFLLLNIFYLTNSIFKIIISYSFDFPINSLNFGIGNTFYSFDFYNLLINIKIFPFIFTWVKYDNIVFSSYENYKLLTFFLLPNILLVFLGFSFFNFNIQKIKKSISIFFKFKRNKIFNNKITINNIFYLIKFFIPASFLFIGMLYLLPIIPFETGQLINIILEKYLGEPYTYIYFLFSMVSLFIIIVFPYFPNYILLYIKYRTIIFLGLKKYFIYNIFWTNNKKLINKIYIHNLKVSKNYYYNYNNKYKNYNSVIKEISKDYIEIDNYKFKKYTEYKAIIQKQSSILSMLSLYLNGRI